MTGPPATSAVTPVRVNADATGPSRPTSTLGDMSRWQRLRSSRPVRFVGFVLGRVFGTPIAEGRLADNGWPAGLRGIVVATVCCYAALTVAIGATGWLRGHDQLLFTPPGLTLPQAAVPVVLAGVAASLACFVTAVLHARVWARLGSMIIVESIVLRQVSWSDPDWRTWISWAVAALLLVLVAARWRGRFHWAEFVAALVLTGTATAVNTSLLSDTRGGAGFDPTINGLQLMLLPLWCLAGPIALLGGAAMVELTSSTSVWVVTGAWRAIGSTSRPRLLAAIGVGVLLAGRAVQFGHRVVVNKDGDYLPTAMAWGALEFCLVAAAAWGIQHRALRRPHTTWRPDADDITTRWSGVSLWMAVIFAIPTLGPNLLSHVMTGLGVPRMLAQLPTTFGVRWRLPAGAALSGLAMLALAWRWSGRGHRRAPMLMTCVAGVTLCATLNTMINAVVNISGMVLGATLASIVVGIWAMVTRRMTPEAGVALAAVLLLGTLYDYRDVIDEPLTALFALTGVAASLVVGLIWRLLTDNSWTRGDSRRFPRSARVLLALASSLFAVTVVATVSLSGGMFTLTLSLSESVGDQFLGVGLITAVSTSALIVAVSGRRVRDVPYGPRDPFVRPRRAATSGAPGRVEPDESARRSRSGQPG